MWRLQNEQRIEVEYWNVWYCLLQFCVMKSLISVISIVVCVVILASLKSHLILSVQQIEHYPDRLIQAGSNMSYYSEKHGPSLRHYPGKGNSTLGRRDGRFTVIIVSFNEELLEKTYFWKDVVFVEWTMFWRIRIRNILRKYRIVTGSTY